MTEALVDAITGGAEDAGAKVAAFTGDINATCVLRGSWYEVTPLMAAVHARRRDVIDALQSRGDVDPNRTNGIMGLTALHMAVSDAINGIHVPQSMITPLLAAFPATNVNMATTNWSNTTPLGLCVPGTKCARLRRLAIAELLQAGADPNLPCNSSGRSAKHEAHLYINLSIMRLLNC